MQINLDAVDSAIAGTRVGLEASGFTIACSGEGGRLLLTVSANQGACEDCLVPKPVFTSIVRKELGAAGLLINDIDVTYPVEVDDELT